jgi:hypothetical protein
MLFILFTILSATVFAIQIYFVSVHFYLINEFDSSHTLALNHYSSSTDVHLEDEPRHNDRRKAFGACIMVKDDNDLLYEWIAYHYTVLPLGYLVVGSDIDNTQDPSIVLNRWTQANISNLRYWILQPSDFAYRHDSGIINNYNNGTQKLSASALFTNATNASEVVSKELLLSTEEWKTHHHHALVDRQKGFVSTCSEILKKEGVDWTLYIDSDEFIVWNPWTLDDETNISEVHGTGHESISNRSFEIRKQLASQSSVSSSRNFHELIVDLQRNGDISECYTLPRLLVGSLENRTCPEKYGVNRVQQLARTQLHERFKHMSTLRFFQHAKKGDFSRSKFGKVMMDLTKVSYETIRLQRPRNIHRPYTAHCGAAGGVNFPDTFFYLMHYVGSWERYSSRKDDRRGRFEWENRAFVDDDVRMSACASTVHNWYLQFSRLVGEERRNFLLGKKTSMPTNNTHIPWYIIDK